MASLFHNAALAAGITLCLAGAALAQDQVLNLYSARHYATDEALYDNFTKTTGIKINRVDADDAGILARLKAEGTASPADAILLVDAARLWKGEEAGLFLPIKSKVLDDAIPPQYRAKPDANGATSWFGFSTRARVIVYDKLKVKRADVDTYEKLADPVNKGKLCIRSGSHPYNLSLFGAMVEHMGPAKTEAWLKGMVDNMARTPKGGDEGMKRGIRVKTSSYTRHHVNITMTQAKAVSNYTNSILANMEALDDGYDEALLLDSSGFVSEGAGENVFVIKNGVIYTPDLSAGALNGITRNTVFHIAKDLGLEIVQKRITRDEVYICDEAFFTGTAAEVTPIRELDRIELGGGSRGPITEKIQSAFFDIVNGRNPKYAEWLSKV